MVDQHAWRRIREKTGAITVEEALYEITADYALTVQDLLELLESLPIEARKITKVLVPELGYDSIIGNLTRRGMDFRTYGSGWVLELDGDTCAKGRE